MEKQEFIYSIEDRLDGGIDIFTGPFHSQRFEGILNFTDETSLIEALKEYKKSLIIAWDDNPILLQEGERLSKKLGLKFIHP